MAGSSNKRVMPMAIFFLFLLVSNEAIETRSKILSGIEMNRQRGIESDTTMQKKDESSFHSHKETTLKHLARATSALDSLIEEEAAHGDGDVFIRGDYFDEVRLTPSQIADIHKSLNEDLRFENSPFLLELDSMTPVGEQKETFTPEESSKHHGEIANLMEKVATPLHELANVFGSKNVEYPPSLLEFESRASESVGERKLASDTSSYLETSEGDQLQRWGYVKDGYNYVSKKSSQAYSATSKAVNSAYSTTKKYAKKGVNAVVHTTKKVYHSAKHHAVKAYDWADRKITQKTTGSNSANGGCEKTTTFMTCGGNEECRPTKVNPCNGLCQCNSNGVNNCECVHTLTFPPSMTHIMDDQKQIGDALTVGGAAFSAVWGYIDGFLGGMLTEFKEPWATDKACLALKTDFSQGMKNIVKSFRYMLRTIGSNAKYVFTSKTARKKMLGSLKGVLSAFTGFVGDIVPGLWHCPATRTLVITFGVIAAAIAANVAFIAAGWVIVPLIIKWVGAIVGLFFSFKYLKASIKTLVRNIGFATRGTCKKECKEMIVEKGFAILGCLTEVILMGGIGEVLSFGMKNPSKVAAKGGKFQVKFNKEMVHDIRVVKDVAKNAKHGVKSTMSKLSKKLHVKTPGGGKPPKLPPKVKADKLRRGGDVNPINNMAEADRLMRQGKFSCDNSLKSEQGVNPIMDNVKYMDEAKKKKLQAEPGRKPGTTKYDDEIQAAKNNADSFHNGEYNVIVLDEPITLYRAGPKDRKMGQYWTKQPPKDRFSVRYDAAVKNEWSDLDNVYSLELPAGTKMYEGYVANQGGMHRGMGEQIFIDKPWNIPGVSDAKVKTVATWGGDGAGFDYVGGIKRYTNSFHGHTSSAREVAEIVTKARQRNQGRHDGDFVGSFGQSVKCARGWFHGIDTDQNGKCEKTGAGNCQDGIFAKGHCPNLPQNIKCCLRKKCMGSGSCTFKSKCSGPGKTWESGHCPGPSNIRCCVDEKALGA